MSEYIERDAAINAVFEAFADGRSAYDALNNLPAADVRPVVRGFNVDKAYPSLFECSVCGWSDGDTTTGDTRTYNFCPNCGAKMGGDV